MWLGVLFGMERIRTLTGTLVATLLYFTSIGVDAKVLPVKPPRHLQQR